VVLAVLAAAACGVAPPPQEVVRFWGLGREGEVVDELLDPFRAEHPELEVEVQQIPFTAAHEKLLTALIGARRRTSPRSATPGSRSSSCLTPRSRSIHGFRARP